MSELRDARLHRALEAAPDAQPAPRAQTRLAVLNAAHAAVAPVPRERWWRRWWAGAGRPQVPWNAAFATVLLASLVTVLWREQEIPDAATQVERHDSHVPLSAPAPAPAPQAATPSPSAAVPKARQQPQAPAQIARESVASNKAANAADALETARARAAAATEVDIAADIGAAASAARATAPAAASAVAAPPRVIASAPTPRAVAPSTRTSDRVESAPRGWTHVRIEIDGNRREVPRSQAVKLAELFNTLLAVPMGGEALVAPPIASIEMMTSNGESMGLLEIVPPQIRWIAANGAAASVPQTARPDPAQLEALRTELLRLARR